MERFYRRNFKTEDLVFFQIVNEQSDLYIGAEKMLIKEAEESLANVRAVLQKYIAEHPSFLYSLKPVSPEVDAPVIIKEMCSAAYKANVGPMAAVAGAVSQFVGRSLSRYSSNVIVENGGDLFIKTSKERKVGIYAGNSPLSNKLSIKISPSQTPCGVCTSSGTIGHSLSFGRADAALVCAKSPIVADAAATALGNMVSVPDDLNAAVDTIKNIPEVFGILVVLGDRMAVWGDIELCRL